MSHTTTYTRQAPSYTGGQTWVNPTSYQAWRKRDPYEYVSDQPGASHANDNRNSHIGTLHLVGASDPSATSHNAQDRSFHNGPPTTSSARAHSQDSMTMRHVPPRPMDPSHRTVNGIMKAATSFRPSVGTRPQVTPSSMPATAGPDRTVPLSQGRTSQWPDFRYPPPPFVEDLTATLRRSFHENKDLTTAYLRQELSSYGMELNHRQDLDKAREETREARDKATHRSSIIAQLVEQNTQLSDKYDSAVSQIAARDLIIDDLQRDREYVRSGYAKAYATVISDPWYRGGDNLQRDFAKGDWSFFSNDGFPPWDQAAS